MIGVAGTRRKFGKLVMAKWRIINKRKRLSITNMLQTSKWIDNTHYTHKLNLTLPTCDNFFKFMDGKDLYCEAINRKI